MDLKNVVDAVDDIIRKQKGVNKALIPVKKRIRRA